MDERELFMSEMMSVVTIPIKTEKWQDDMLEKRFRAYRETYNVLLAKMKKELGKLQHNPEYMESYQIIMSAYDKELSEGERKKIKNSEEYKLAKKRQQEMLREKGFSQFGLCRAAKDYYKYYDMHIPSSTVARSITNPMWAAFEKLIFGNGQKVAFKRQDDFRRIASDGKSGLRIVDENGKTVFSRSEKKKLYVSFGTRGNKILTMPIAVPKKDIYKAAMLERTWKVVSIVRKKIKYRYRYFVQLTIVGSPEKKVNRRTGEVLHPIKNGKLGIYIDSRYVVVCDEMKNCHTYDLLGFSQLHENEIVELSRYMDRSMRINNPENFNSDGTIKKGIIKNGKRRRLYWKNSRKYYLAKDKVADLYRKDSETRKIQRNMLANTILTMGDDIVVNDFPFELAKQRKKKDELTKKGTSKSKKKAGAIIQKTAPSALVTTMEAKLAAKENSKISKVKLENINKKEKNYRENCARLLVEWVR